MKCNLIVNVDYVKVTIINNSNWVMVTDYKFADANSTVNIPLVFLEDADASCVAASVGTISGNTLSVPVTTSNVTVTLTNAKAQVRVENHVQYHVTGITPSVQYVTAGQSAQFTLTYAEGYTPTDLCATIGTVSNTTLTVPTQASDIYVDTTIFRGSMENIELGVSSSYETTYSPTTANSSYNVAQLLYVNSELGNRGTIRSISFKKKYGSDVQRTLDIYMENVDITALPTTFTSAANSQQVYSGNITFIADDWATITLDNPFMYDNTKNLLITVLDNTGIYDSGSKYFAAYSTSARGSVSAYRSNAPYDITQITTYSANNKSTTKNSIKIFKMDEIEDGPDPEPVIEPTIIEIGVSTGSAAIYKPNMPLNSRYNYSLTEQIYLPSEIGQSGTITEIGYNYYENTTMDRVCDIYLLYTDKNKFNPKNSGVDATEEYICPSASNLVFSGTAHFARGWSMIQLDRPFVYDGVHNLCVVVHDRTLSTTSSSRQFIVNETPADSRKLMSKSSVAAFDPTDAVSLTSGTNYTTPYRNVIRFGMI